MFLKNKIAYLGRVLMALGLIFLAMDSMAVALAPLQTSPYFINMFGHLDNPLTAILVGTVFTALISKLNCISWRLANYLSKGIN